MNDVLRGKLVELIRQQGPNLLEDRARLEGMLWLAIGEHGYGMFALMGALERHIPHAILTTPSERRNADLFDKLVRRLVTDLDVDESTAQWAVESWDLAVHDLPQQTPPPPRAVKPTPQPAPPPRAAPKPPTPSAEHFANAPLLSLDGPEPAAREPPTTPEPTSPELPANDPIPFAIPDTEPVSDPAVFLRGHQAAVTCLAVCSPDGQVIATGSADRTVILWNANGSPRVTLTCKDRVVAVAFAPDSRTLASASADGSIQLWEVQRGQGRGVLPCEKGWPTALAFAPDGKTLLAGGRDGTVRLWRVADGSVANTLASHGDELLAVAFGPSGLAVATAGEDGKTRLWDVSRNRAWATLTGHHEAVTGVAFSKDGKLLATSSRDGTVKLWNAVTGREIGQLEVDRQQHSEVLRSVAFAPDGRTLAASAEDNAVHVWDVVSRQHLTSFTGGGGPVASVTYTPDGRWLLAAGADGVVRRWQVPTPRRRPLYDDPIRRPVRRGSSGGGKKAGAIGGVISGVIIVLLIALRVIFGNSNRQNNINIPQFNPQINQQFPQVKFPKFQWQDAPRSWFGHQGGVTSVAVSPDGNRILSGGCDNMVRLWDFQGGQLRQLGGLADRHTKHILAVAFSPDGTRALSVGLDGDVKLWDLTTGNRLQTYHHESGVTSVAFSQDGKRFISGCGFDKVTYKSGNPQLNVGEQLLWNRSARPGAVYVWMVENPRDNTVLRTPVPGDQISCVAYSADGRYILGGCFDKTVHVWDAENFGRVHNFKGHQGEVFTVAAVPTGLNGPNLNRAVSGATKLGLPEDLKKENLQPVNQKRHLRVWDVQTGQEVFQIPAHERGILSAAVSQDGTQLLTTGFDRFVRLWDLNTRQMLREYQTPCLVNSVTFSPDGRSAVWGSWDGQIQTWRVRE